MNIKQAVVDYFTKSPDTAHKPEMPLEKRWLGEAIFYGLAAVSFTTIGIFGESIKKLPAYDVISMVMIAIIGVTCLFAMFYVDRYKKDKKEDEMTKSLQDHASGSAAKVMLAVVLGIVIIMGIARKDIVLSYNNSIQIVCGIIYWFSCLRSAICYKSLRKVSAEDEEE